MVAAGEDSLIWRRHLVTRGVAFGMLTTRGTAVHICSLGLVSGGIVLALGVRGVRLYVGVGISSEIFPGSLIQLAIIEY